MILLDTHALLWYLNDDPQLPPVVRDVIVRQSLVYVSAAVIWEISIKGSLGKLFLGSKPIDSKEAVEKIIAESTAQEFEFLDVTPEHAAQAPFLRGTHRDPFDRLLAAQSLQQELTLVSRDASFDELSPNIKRFWAEGRARGLSTRKRVQNAGDKTSG